MAISCFYVSISSAETSIVPGDSHVGLSGLLGMTVLVGCCQHLFRQAAIRYVAGGSRPSPTKHLNDKHQFEAVLVFIASTAD